MRLLIYFLIIANAVFLFWNWDSLSDVASSKGREQILAKETLVIKGNNTNVITPPQGDYEPPVSRTTSVINSVLAVLNKVWQDLKDIFSDRSQQLPESPVEEQLPPPPKSSPTPPQPPSHKPPLINCYRLSGYANSQEALTDKAVLRSYGIDTGIFAGKVTGPFTYRIFVKVRTDLDVAKDLSDILFSEGVRNTIKEDPPLGFLLISSTYTDKKQADSVNAKLKRLGFSSYVNKVGGGKVSKIYYLLIPQSEATDWEEVGTIVRPELNSKINIIIQPTC